MSILEHVSPIGWDNRPLCGVHIGNPPNHGLEPTGGSTLPVVPIGTIKALTRQRTLLIVDNLETVDDERVNAFLRELPAPTKAIVTTRHRIDVAYPVRLTGMPQEDGLRFIAQECEKKGVTLIKAKATKLYDRTGGVPLAIVWSVAQMGYGYDAEYVLHRLDQSAGDVARFCFEGIIERIHNTHAHRLLRALSLFATGATRRALGYVANLPERVRDEGLAELEKLSLVNKQADRFTFLPLTKKFALDELIKLAELEKKDIQTRWIGYLKSFGSNTEYYWGFRRCGFVVEGPNIEALQWCYEHGTTEDVFSLTLAASDYLDAIGDWSTLLTLCYEALRLAKRIQNPVAIARFVSMQGWLFGERSEYPRAEASLLKALRHYRENKKLEGTVFTLLQLSIVYRKAKEFGKAENLCKQAEGIADELNRDDLKAAVNDQYGKLSRDQEDWQSAWKHFAQVQEWVEEQAKHLSPHKMLIGSAKGHLAIVAYYLGRFEESKRLCLEDLEFYEPYGVKSYYFTLKYRLALAEKALGEYETAIKHAREAAEWLDLLGMKPDLAKARDLLEQLEYN